MIWGFKCYQKLKKKSNEWLKSLVAKMLSCFFTITATILFLFDCMIHNIQIASTIYAVYPTKYI